MRKCTKCLVPETVDTITFDEEGVCSVCRQVEFKEEKIDWDARWAQLQEIIAEYKDKGPYDCIVPYSGGKDSVFQLYYIVRVLKLKPLSRWVSSSSFATPIASACFAPPSAVSKAEIV